MCEKVTESGVLWGNYVKKHKGGKIRSLINDHKGKRTHQTKKGQGELNVKNSGGEKNTKIVKRLG